MEINNEFVTEISKEFQLRLKENYNPDGLDIYGFCYFSREFVNLWITPQGQDIVDLADQFLESEKGQPFSNLFCTDNGYLFVNFVKHETIQNQIEVRKQFLDWVISNYE